VSDGDPGQTLLLRELAVDGAAVLIGHSEFLPGRERLDGTMARYQEAISINAPQVDLQTTASTPEADSATSQQQNDDDDEQQCEHGNLSGWVGPSQLFVRHPSLPGFSGRTRNAFMFGVAARA
jgi:hypothetical protein